MFLSGGNLHNLAAVCLLKKKMALLHIALVRQGKKIFLSHDHGFSNNFLLHKLFVKIISLTLNVATLVHTLKVNNRSSWTFEINNLIEEVKVYKSQIKYAYPYIILICSI